MEVGLARRASATASRSAAAKFLDEPSGLRIRVVKVL